MRQKNRESLRDVPQTGKGAEEVSGVPAISVVPTLLLLTAAQGEDCSRGSHFPKRVILLLTRPSQP